MPISRKDKPVRKAAKRASASAPVERKTPARRASALPAKDPLVRVQRAIERELEKIELIIGEAGAGERDAERTARTLAVLARTLKDVAQISTAKAKAAKAKPTTTKRTPESADGNGMPRDLDEFRRELAQRLDALVAAAEAADPEPAK